MKKDRKGKSRGFTLIELMIVVVIMGVLAAVALPAFLKFVRTSKTSEAPINMRAISNGAVEWFDAEHMYSNTGKPMRKHFPHDGPDTQVRNGPKTMRRPLEPPCEKGRVAYKKNSKHWLSRPWKHLKFAIGTSHYFQYQYTYDNNDKVAPSFTVHAHADLDCDKNLSTYIRTGEVNKKTGEVEMSDILVLDALE